MARALYPVFLDLVERSVLVVGGGRVAAPKVSRLVEAGANVFVVSPSVAPEIEQLPVRLARREFEPRDLDGCWYVVSAAPPEVNARVAREAHARGIFVNAVDDPRQASAFAGSGFRRGPVTVAISTGGEAPALARIMREALERLVGRDVEAWSDVAARLRGDWRREQLPMDQRRDALLATFAELHREAASAPSPAAGRGFVSLVGAGPGDAELLTRRAARRLAEADLVLYDALVSPATVSLATSAQRILVGRRRGSASVGQGAIIRTLIRAARRGRRVVRLKGGDPFVFGRGGEEALALAGAGVPFEVVPGVSSAFAAPALASIPVTHRGLSSAVMVTTGHDIERFAALMRGMAPGSATLVILMGTAHRSQITSALRAGGWQASTPAAIVWNASGPTAAVWTGPLDALGEAEEIEGEPGTIVVGEVVALRDALTSELSTVEREARHG